MKLRSKLFILGALALVTMIALQPMAPYLVSGADEEQLPFADFYMIADGDFNPNLSPASLEAAYHITIPTNYLSSNTPWSIPVKNVKTADGTGSIDKVFFDGHQIRVAFTAILKAPVIDIWESKISNNGGPQLSSENDLQASATDSATSTLSWGLQQMLGSLTYKYQNITDISTSWTYKKSFLLSDYNILILDSAKSAGNAGNMTVTVAYSNSSSTPVNYNSSYVYNATVYNDFISNYGELWFRLDLETLNGSAFNYVNLIDVQNTDITGGGRYIASSVANVTDQRYVKTYFGDRSTFLNLTSIHYNDYPVLNAPGEGPTTNSLQEQHGLHLNGFWDSVTGKSIAKLSSSIKTSASNVVNQAKGWATKTDLENSFKDKIIQTKNAYTSRNQITDLKLSNAVANWDTPSKITSNIKSAYDKYRQSDSTVAKVVQHAEDAVTKRVTFATNLAAKVINDPKGAADDAIDATKSLYGSVKNKASAFGQNVKNKITNTAKNIKDGAVGIWSNVKKTAGGIFKGITKYLPWIIGGVAVLAVLFLFVYFSMMMPRFVPDIEHARAFTHELHYADQVARKWFAKHNRKD